MIFHVICSLAKNIYLDAPNNYSQQALVTIGMDTDFVIQEIFPPKHIFDHLKRKLHKCGEKPSPVSISEDGCSVLFIPINRTNSVNHTGCRQFETPAQTFNMSLSQIHTKFVYGRLNTLLTWIIMLLIYTCIRYYCQHMEV